MKKANFFDSIPADTGEEIFDTIAQNKDILIERIISRGQKSPDGFWYEQDKDEWVMLLQGEAKLEFEEEDILHLKAGDYLLIPKSKKHRIISTSKKPECLWLAIHANLR